MVVRARSQLHACSVAEIESRDGDHWVMAASQARIMRSGNRCDNCGLVIL
jgi:hypothetical protein